MADVKCREEEEGDVTTENQRVKELFREWDALTEPITTPIVYHPGGWADTVPEELRKEVLRQRIEKANNGGWDEATDAEVLCYLMTASLVQPLTSDWTQIYLYQTSQFMPQVRDAIPDMPKELTEYQKSELRDLKRKIRNSQINRRKSNRKEKAMPKRKLVLEEHEGSTMVGIMQDGCDPFIKTIDGGLDEAVAAIPGFLTEAQEKWAVQPKNPAHVPPVPPKPAPKPAAATTPGAPKAEELPLLAGTQTEKPAEAKVEEQAPEPEEQEKPAEAEAEVTEAEPEPEVPPVEQAPDTDIDAGEFAEVPSQIAPESAVAEEKFAQELSERIAQAPAPQPAEPTPSTPAKPGEWEYYLQDGRGPFETVQLAMDELGLDKNTRPTHNRWDRLSTALKEKIQRRPKA